MDQLEKNKIIIDLKNNIKNLQEIIDQQENLLIELLKELDKINKYSPKLDDNI